ncbi:hypothetical protein C1645_828300 [Glomus cerebriforme]|uniref:Uncharacterized protein n=1 Tax=Glomus cerebriforme TaxID=658196 RepID=A0A397SQA4_9GLOM|nr:hypothetical protein C1645_828300 [Glomus cerebriforme]
MMYSYKGRSSLLIVLVLIFLVIDLTNSEITKNLALDNETNEQDGTRNYIEYKNDRKAYIIEMSNKITTTLAVKRGCISMPHDRYQYKNAHQILLRVDIKGTKIPDQPSSFALRNILDKMIIHKGTYAIPAKTVQRIWIPVTELQKSISLL